MLVQSIDTLNQSITTNYMEAKVDDKIFQLEKEKKTFLQFEKDKKFSNIGMTNATSQQQTTDVRNKTPPPKDVDVHEFQPPLPATQSKQT